jgi:peptidoglycan-N-acetylglucosamine deacetylase
MPLPPGIGCPMIRRQIEGSRAMRVVGPVAVAGFLAVFAIAGMAEAAECKGNPSAIGTSRVLTVDPTEHARIGAMNYTESLPLQDHEVVLTFDDGPLPPHTTQVLNTLASQCVKATFFIVGRMANEFSSLVRRAYKEGHTIATHSQNHPWNIQKMPADAVEKEVEDGIASVSAALGDPGALAPFFRFPGFGRKAEVEQYLAAKGIMVWSADFPADDWKHISSKQVMARALSRLEHHGKGILLLHDMQPATVRALPDLLKELKKRNFRIVHVVPAGADQPKTVTDPQQWVLPPKRDDGVRVTKSNKSSPTLRLVPVTR